MRALFFAALAMCLAACASTAPVDPPSPVGMQQRDWVDPARQAWGKTSPRPLHVVIWYPTTDGATETSFAFPPNAPVFVGGDAAVGAPLRPGAERLPLVVLSHGTGGAAVQMMWLGRALAERGYIAAAVDHHGNTGMEPAYDARGFRLFWERADDLSRVIDGMLSDPVFGPRVDSTRIGAAGFSLGGYSVLALAGARLDFQRFQRFCGTPDADGSCGPIPEYPNALRDFEALANDPQVRASLARETGDFRDPRVRAVFAMAPALGPAFTPESLKAVATPTEIAIAGADDLLAPRMNGEAVARQIPDARVFTVEERAGHYVFLNTCAEAVRGKGLVFCEDAPGVDRAQVHDKTAQAALAFFGRTLPHR